MSINKAYDVLLDPVTSLAINKVGIQKVTRTIPAVANYWDFFCELENLTAANIALINVRANNTIIQQYVGTDLDSMNVYNGLPPSTAAPTNPVLNISQRRNRAFGGGIQRLTAAKAGASVPVVLTSGSPKDLETESTLNCNSQDSAGNEIATLLIEFYVVNTGADQPTITLTGYGCDPYPGGPGLIKYVDMKTYNATVGTNILDKNTAFNIGDGMRLNLDQIFFIPAAGTMDNWIHYLQSTPIRQRSENLNEFVQLTGVIKVLVGGVFVLDLRELLYGDETIPIGSTKAQFRTQVDIEDAGNVTIYQCSEGTLFPTAS
jgi:Viral coat protein P2 N-terminal domain